jgi:hypothetical protein
MLKLKERLGRSGREIRLEGGKLRAECNEMKLEEEKPD